MYVAKYAIIYVVISNTEATILSQVARFSTYHRRITFSIFAFTFSETIFDNRPS